MMRILASEGFVRFNRARARLGRAVRGEKPAVHYFHEVADPYSHLAVQRLDALRARYSIPFRVHLTSPARDEFRGDATRYPQWAMTDAGSIAPGFGVSFPQDPLRPAEGEVNAALVQLAPFVDTDEFAYHAIDVGSRLWSGRMGDSAPDQSVLCHAGNALREQHGHYAGGMFWFDGEWYWGLDRLELLERRLIDEGYGSGQPLVPRPHFHAGSGGEHLTLEIFPSLRSPYTAISFDRAAELADRTGVRFVIRPVMPMMMRGVSAPPRKGTYIMSDAAREARRDGIPFGRIVDPFGPPVILGFSLYPFAERAGRAREYVSRYLRAAWAEGVDITGEEGLRLIVEDIGLSWEDARSHLGGNEAEAMLEENINDMLAAGLWGVPSFRVSGGDAPPFICWGQDRLWRVEQEIANRLERA